MWSGNEDYVEAVDLRRGDSLGRDADSSDTDGVSDWIRQGGPNANGATPSARNMSPLLTLDTEMQIVDTTIGMESIGDYLEPNDSAVASISVCSRMADPVAAEVWLQTDEGSGIVVPDEPILIETLSEESCTCIKFPISTSEASPGLHTIDFTLVATGEEIFSEAQVLVLATAFDIELEALFDRGQVGVSLESIEGKYNFTVRYDPIEIQTFDETSIAPLLPISETVTFTPFEAFLGTHPPEIVNAKSATWEKKLLFGIANFFALEITFLKTALGTVSENGLEGVIRVLKTKGWKYTFNLVANLLGRYPGMLGILLGLGSSIISAYAADSPQGDTFYVGEENTDPGDALTIEERVDVFFEGVDSRFGEPTRVIGRRTFTRVLAGGSKLVYIEDFDVVRNDSIIIDAFTDRLSYKVGDVVTVSAEAIHGTLGVISGNSGILTAGIYPEVATAASVASLRDDGVYPDPIAYDGIYTCEVVITNEVVCSGGDSLSLFVIAQQTYHEIDTGKVPNFFIGFEELRVNVEGIPPSADVVAFLYDGELEMTPASVSSLDIEVRNIGQVATDDIIRVEAWMSSDDEIDGSDALIGILEVGELPASESVRLELSFTVPALDEAGD